MFHTLLALPKFLYRIGRLHSFFNRPGPTDLFIYFESPTRWKNYANSAYPFKICLHFAGPALGPSWNPCRPLLSSNLLVLIFFLSICLSVRCSFRWFLFLCVCVNALNIFLSVKNVEFYACNISILKSVDIFYFH